MKRPDAEKLGDDLSKYLIEGIKKDGSIEMTIFVVSGEKTRAIKGFDANSGNQKAMIAELARHLSKKYKANSIILSCESFTACAENATVEDMKDLERYRQTHGTMEGHPLTREAVFLAVEIPDDTVIRCYPFERDEQGKVNKIGTPMTFPEGGALDGVLCKMMSPEKRYNIPGEILDEMEKLTVEVIPTKRLGLYMDVAHSPTMH